MRSRLLILPFLMLLLPFVYHGCSREEYLPGLTGKMVGQIYTFNEFGYLLDDHGQVKISAIGMDQTYTANSNRSGRFELSDVPTGTYELHFEKSGFGVLKQFGVQHLGGEPTILPFVDFNEHAYFLYEMPSTTITNMTLLADSLSVDFSFALPDPPNTVSIRVYFSASENFTLATAEYVEPAYLWNVGGHYYRKLNFQEAAFNPGERIYFKACLWTTSGAFYPPMQNNRMIYGVSTYFDIERNEIVYPNLGDESEQYSFIFPE